MLITCKRIFLALASFSASGPAGLIDILWVFQIQHVENGTQSIHYVLVTFFVVIYLSLVITEGMGLVCCIYS